MPSQPDAPRGVPAGRPGRIDAATAAAVTVLALLVFALQEPGEQASRGPDLPGALLVLVLGGALAWRRRAPVATVAVVVGATGAILAAGYVVAVGQLVLSAALGSLALHGSRRAVVPTLAVVTALAALALLLVDEPVDGAVAVTVAGVLLLPALVGAAVRAERTAGARARELAGEVALRGAAEVEAATAAERLRIAREVHDVVGHHLSAIAVQAHAARATLADDPAATGISLDHIATSATRALQETGQALARLREEPGLTELAELLDDAGRHGLALQTELPDPLPRVDAAVGTCVHRIAREALTNARRHGAGAARVRLHDAGERLVLTVANPLVRAPSPHGDGTGIAGMRERAALVGGELEAGPRDGSWVLEARIPVERA